ncbi:MAG: DUF3515 domain-containing protein, partial [Sporichthyaceae bacterium]
RPDPVGSGDHPDADLPGRPPLKALVRAATAACALALLAAPAGCGRDPLPAVAVSPPDVPQPAQRACESLAGGLPPRIDGESRRVVEPPSPYTAAWGEPAVVLRCGVARPGGLTATSMLNTVNGVDWFLEELTGLRRFTTAGRALFVEVSVPNGHDPLIGPLVDLAAALTAQIPALPR